MLGDVEGVTIVGEAETPASAIDGILRTRPDSVVLDIQLTGGSGIEVLRRICPVAPNIVFIMLTNHPDPQYRKICMQSGATLFSRQNDRIRQGQGSHRRPGHRALTVYQPTKATI